MKEFLYSNKDPYSGSDLLYRVNRAGIGRVGRDFDIIRNSSYPYCVIHYVAEGSGFVECRGRKHPVGPGQLFVLTANEGHRYRTDAGHPFLLQWVELSGGDCARLTGAFLDAHSPVVDVPDSLTASRLLLRICTLLQKDTHPNQVLLSKMLYALLVNLFALCLDGNRQQSLSRLPEMEKVLRHIDGHLQENLDISSLASIAGFNPQYFSKLFHKHFGMPPGKYIAAKRIHCAKERLSGSGVSVEQLAEELGFCSASHFIRLFKQREGLTPAEFRRQSDMYLRREL